MSMLTCCKYDKRLYLLFQFTCKRDDTFDVVGFAREKDGAFEAGRSQQLIYMCTICSKHVIYIGAAGAALAFRTRRSLGVCRAAAGHGFTQSSNYYSGG